MTFWQENYGFVKDVYDFRLQKYQEWMDNLEGIVSKVMTPNVQYTYKEFKTIQDSLTVSIRERFSTISVFISLCSDWFYASKKVVLIEDYDKGYYITGEPGRSPSKIY